MLTMPPSYMEACKCNSCATYTEAKRLVDIPSAISPIGKSFTFTGLPAAKGIVSGRLACALDKGPAGSIGLHNWYQKTIKEGDILIARMTTPDVVPFMRRLRGIVTLEGGILCHAAIMAREFKIPAVVGCAKSIGTFFLGRNPSFDSTTTVTVDGGKGLVVIQRGGDN